MTYEFEAFDGFAPTMGSYLAADGTIGRSNHMDPSDCFWTVLAMWSEKDPEDDTPSAKKIKWLISNNRPFTVRYYCSSKAWPNFTSDISYPRYVHFLIAVHNDDDAVLLRLLYD